MSFKTWQQENQQPASDFNQWYAGHASRLGLDPNPDDPRHFYDYRAAYKAGVEPPAQKGGHWPSEYKLEGHPRMVLDGMDTKTGKSVDGFAAWQIQNKSMIPQQLRSDMAALQVEDPDAMTAEDWAKLGGKGPNFLTQSIGALAKGTMRVGEAVTAIPENTVRLAKTIYETGQVQKEMGDVGSWSPTYLYAAAEQVRKDPEIGSRIEAGLTAELKNITNMHRHGTRAIIKAHPEWESDPPESFLDLVTSPRKLALSLLESTPLLLAAGITTAAGQPSLSLSMMFTVEFQDMKNMALADGRTEQEAQAAGLLYAPIAAGIEQMQLQGLMTVAKGMHKPLLALTAKKITAKGLKPAYPVIKTMVNEAIEEMAQGGWQEASAKLVYGKSIEGGLRGFIDRRLQESYTGGAMALIPGLGGRAYRAGTTPKTSAIEVLAQEAKAVSPEIESPPLIVKEPTTADQAIGQQYGLTNEQTDSKLSEAEHRYHELKLKDPVSRTVEERGELAFLRRNRANVEALLERETSPQAPKVLERSKSNLRVIAHKVQREAGVSDTDYRDMAEIVTGKRSMKDMTRQEMDDFTSAIEDAYGKPSELNIEDFEAPVVVADRETTMGAIHRDAVNTVADLTPEQKIPKTVKAGFGKTGTIGRLKSFFFGIDNTPVYHLARILDGGTEGIFSEVLDKNIQAGQKVTRSHLRSVFDALNTALTEAGVTAEDLAKMSRAVNPRLQTHQWLRSKAATETLSESFNGRDYEVSWANLIDIYLMSNQKSGMKHLLNGGLVINTVETGKLTDERINELRQKVEDNPKTLAIVDAIMNVEARIWKPSINEVSNRLEGKDIASVPDWWGHEVYNPQRLVGKQRPSMSRTHEVNLMEDKSILRDRTKSTAPLVVRDALNRFSVFESAIAEYAGMAEPTRTSRTLLNDTAVTSDLARKGYGRVVGHIAEIHKRAQSVNASEGSFTAFFAQHLPGLYRAVLYFNPRVVASQFTSVTNYGAYVSPEFMGSMKDGLSVANAQETLAMSDFAWGRFNMGHSSLELGEMAKADAALKLWTGKASDINKLGWTLKVADLGALTAGMSIAQQEYIKAQKGELEGLSAEWWLDKDDLPDADVEMWRRVQEQGEEADPAEMEATEIWKQTVTERAEYLWQRTQPSWDKWNRSLLTTQKGVRRLFLLFRSFHEKSLTIFNEAKLDYEQGPKTMEDKARFVQRTGSVMAGYTLNMALRLAILAGMTRKVKEPLHYLQDFLTSWMAMFPIFGKVLDASSRKFIAEATDTTAEYRGEPLGSFPIKMVNIALKAPTDFAGAAGNFVAGDSDAAVEDLEKGIKKIYEGVGALYGIPVYEIKRVLPKKDEGTTTGRGRRGGQRRTGQTRNRRSRS